MSAEQPEGLLLTVTPQSDTGEARRNSTGAVAERASSSQSNGKGKVLPHYLRTSKGSCHDFCKYGRKDTFETKGKCPVACRYSRSSALSDKGQNQVKISGLDGNKKKNSVQQKSKTHKEKDGCTAPEVSEDNGSSPSVRNNTFEESKINQTSIHHGGSGSSEPVVLKFNSRSGPEEIGPLGQVKPKMSGSCDDAETATQDIPVSLNRTQVYRAFETTGKERIYAKKNYLTPNSTDMSLTSARCKTQLKAPRPIKRTNAPPNLKDSKIVLPPYKKCEAPEKTTLSKKSSMAFQRSQSQEKLATAVAVRNARSKGVKQINLLGPAEKKNGTSSPYCAPQPLSLHSKSVSARNAEKSIPKIDKIRQRTLHILGSEATEGGTVESVQSRQISCQPSPVSVSLSSPSSVSEHEEEKFRDSESALSEACDSTSDHGGDGTNIADENENKKQRRGGICITEHKGQTPYKLKFRRGKTLNPESDHGMARRLRFRQGTRIGDSRSGEGEMEKISFKKSDPASEEPAHSDAEPQTVELRHQDVQDKKDAISLFNHVIEETASKLAETRKSKVKALVGAFETVISLQDKKPATSV